MVFINGRDFFSKPLFLRSIRFHVHNESSLNDLITRLQSEVLETQHLPIENKNKVMNQDIRTFEASLHEEFNRCDQLRQGNTQIKFEDNNWSWGDFWRDFFKFILKNYN